MQVWNDRSNGGSGVAHTFSDALQLKRTWYIHYHTIPYHNYTIPYLSILSVPYYQYHTISTILSAPYYQYHTISTIPYYQYHTILSVPYSLNLLVEKSYIEDLETLPDNRL